MLDEDNFALLADKTSIQYYINKQKVNDKTYMSKDSFSQAISYSSWMFGLNSPFHHNMSSFLQRCTETGIYQKVLKQSILIDEPHLQIETDWTCTDCSGHKNKRQAAPALGLEHLQLMFGSWFAGIIISMGMFLGELASHIQRWWKQLLNMRIPTNPRNAQCT